MFIIVDLPEPEGPVATNSPRSMESDTLQRVHRHAAHAIVLHQVFQLNQRIHPYNPPRRPPPAPPPPPLNGVALDAEAPALLENAATIAGSPALRSPPLISV